MQHHGRNHGARGLCCAPRAPQELDAFAQDMLSEKSARPAARSHVEANGVRARKTHDHVRSRPFRHARPLRRATPGRFAATLAALLAASVPAFAQALVPQTRIATPDAPADGLRIEHAAVALPTELAQLADGKVWKLAPGADMTLSFDLPDGARGVRLFVRELGWNDAGEGAGSTTFTLNGKAVSRPSAAAGAAVTQRFPRRADGWRFRDGANELVIANEGARALGVQALTLSFGRPAPSGQGLTTDWLEPLPWDGSGDSTLRTPHEQPAAALVPLDIELELLSPRVGQSFAAGDPVRIAWQARGFPAGSGVSIHVRAAGGAWQAVPGAERLPFDAPAAGDGRGAFTWTPDEPLAGVEIGLGYVAHATREPRTFAVGGEDGYATIAQALAQAWDGDTIFVRNGTWIEPVVLVHDVRLVGEDPERCILLSPEPRGIVIAAGVTATVQNMTIDGSSREETDDAWGVHVPGGSATLENLVIRNVYRGVVVNWEATAEAEGLVIEDALTGFLSTRGAHARLSSSRITTREDSDAFGLGVWEAGELDAQDVTIDCGSYGSGIHAEGAGSFVRARDTSLSEACPGVWVAERAQVELHDVTSTRTGKEVRALDNGLVVRSGARAQATTCTFVGHREGPTVSGEGSKLALVRSKVRGGQFGVHVYDNGQAEIQGCDIAQASHSCIRVERGGSATITSNQLANSVWGVDVPTDAGQVVISNNTANGMQNCGFFAPRASLRSGNRGSGNGQGLVRER